MKNFGMVLILCAGLTAAACGGLSDDQKTDTSNIAGGLAGMLGSSYGSAYGKLQDTTEFSSVASDQINVAREMSQGITWLAKFATEEYQDRISRGEAIVDSETNAITPFTTCPFTGASATTSTGGIACTMSCPSTSALKAACTISTAGGFTCGGTTYTTANTSYSVTIDLAGLTGSGSSITGSMSMAFNLKADVTGGKLDGKTLDCTMTIPFDIAALKASSTKPAVTPSCDNFACTYDSKAITCEDLKAKTTAGASCS